MNKLELPSDRLRLRLLKSSDLQSSHELHSLQEVDEFNTLGIPKNIEESRATLEGLVAENQNQEISRYSFAIEKKEELQFIGIIALNLSEPKYNSAEVWYKLHPDFWAQGYATEALKAIIAFSFNDLNLHRIEAGCAVQNIGSIKVLEKVGMKREGRKRRALPLKTGWADNFEYAILKEDL